MNENLSLGRIAGIHVGLNWSLLVVAALIAWSLASGILPSQAPGLGAGSYWTAGVIAAVVFLASLLAHELAHSVVAERRGVHVEGITLWLFGGVSRLSGEANTPGTEALITFVGPLTSLLLGVVFLLIGFGLGGANRSGLVPVTFNWLATINFSLGVFNLIPAAPLDGGRILHSLIWARTGDRLHATTIASRAGMVFGYLLIAFGLATFLLTGSVFNGVWSVFLGWFLLSAARAEEAGGLMRQALAGVSVADVMTPSPVQAPDDITVEEALGKYLLVYRHSTLPLHDQQGRLTGLLTLTAVKNVPSGDRATTRVKDVSCPLDQVATASPEEPLVSLLGRLGGCGEGRALVLKNAELVGVVSPSDINRAVQRFTLGRART